MFMLIMFGEQVGNGDAQIRFVSHEHSRQLQIVDNVVGGISAHQLLGVFHESRSISGV
jgi:hypothetical protein